MEFLEEVLEALQEKYEPTESKVKQVSEWVGSKLQCKTEAEDGEDPKEENQEKKEDSTEKIKTEIEKLEEENEDPAKANQEMEEEARKKTEDDLVKSIEKVEEVLIEAYILKAGDPGDRTPPIFFIFRQNLG